jgi:CheY-like chemotaxis protein
MAEQKALVIGQVASLRDALAALLSSLIGVEAVGQASSPAAAVEMLRSGPAALVVLDACSLPAGIAPDVVKEIRAASPQTRCAVLADDVPDWPGMGAPDAFMLLGTPAAELRAIIGGLLSSHTSRSSLSRR